MFFTSVDGYRPSAYDLKDLRCAHCAQVVDPEGETPEGRRVREGGGTGDAGNPERIRQRTQQYVK